jgi:hypothetical protein
LVLELDTVVVLQLVDIHGFNHGFNVVVVLYDNHLHLHLHRLELRLKVCYCIKEEDEEAVLAPPT